MGAGLHLKRENSRLGRDTRSQKAPLPVSPCTHCEWAAHGLHCEPCPTRCGAGQGLGRNARAYPSSFSPCDPTSPWCLHHESTSGQHLRERCGAHGQDPSPCSTRGRRQTQVSAVSPPQGDHESENGDTVHKPSTDWNWHPPMSVRKRAPGGSPTLPSPSKVPPAARSSRSDHAVLLPGRTRTRSLFFK